MTSGGPTSAWNIDQHLMAGDQANTPPLGVRRLPRRAIMACTVPHFAYSGQEAGEETDKIGGAPSRPCQDTLAAPIEVHPL